MTNIEKNIFMGVNLKSILATMIELCMMDYEHV